MSRSSIARPAFSIRDSPSQANNRTDRIEHWFQWSLVSLTGEERRGRRSRGSQLASRQLTVHPRFTAYSTSEQLATVRVTISEVDEGGLPRPPKAAVRGPPETASQLFENSTHIIAQVSRKWVTNVPSKSDGNSWLHLLGAQTRQSPLADPISSRSAHRMRMELDEKLYIGCNTRVMDSTRSVPTCLLEVS